MFSVSVYRVLLFLLFMELCISFLLFVLTNQATIVIKQVDIISLIDFCFCQVGGTAISP